MRNYFVPSYRSVVNLILLTPLVVAVLHVETQESTASLGYLVKLLLVLFLGIEVVWKLRTGTIPAFFLLGVAFFLKGVLILPDKNEYFIGAIKVSTIVFVLPLTIMYAHYSNLRKVDTMFFYFCALLILATIPYHMGVLQNDIAIAAGLYDMRKYSSEGYLFTGPFENIHNAAITLSFASIGVLKYWFGMKKKLMKLVVLLVALVGVFGVYLTYVRTAWVMLFFAAIIMLFYNQPGIKKKVRNFTLAGMIGVAVLMIYAQSEVVQMRFGNTNAYGGEALSEGSGRIVFWQTMFDYLGELDPIRLFFGTGRESGMDYMLAKIDKRLFSHNGFLDVLVSSGIIGFVIFLMFIQSVGKRLFGKIQLARKTSHHKLALIFAVMLIVAIFFQSQQMFWALILVGFLFGINMSEIKQSNVQPDTP